MSACSLARKTVSIYFHWSFAMLLSLSLFECQHNEMGSAHTDQVVAKKSLSYIVSFCCLAKKSFFLESFALNNPFYDLSDC